MGILPVRASTGDVPPCGPDIDVLALPWAGDVQTSAPNFLQPAFSAFPAEVALDDEGASTIQEGADVVG